MHEVVLGVEAFVVVVRYGLGQHAVVKVVAEAEAVGAEVVTDILRHAEVYLASVFGLYVLVEHFLAVAHHHLHQHVFNGRRLLHWRERLQGPYGAFIPYLFTALLLALLLYVAAYELVGRAYQRGLGHAQTVGAFGYVRGARYLVLYHRHALYDAAYGL